jgi:hypothetical protein
VRVRGSLFFRDETRALEPVFKRLQELGIAPVRSGDNIVAQSVPDEIVNKVTTRAAQLRASWRTAPDAKIKTTKSK